MNSLEGRSNSSIDESNLGGIQADIDDLSLANQESTKLPQKDAEIVQNMTPSKAEDIGGVCDASSGLQAMSGTVIDPDISSPFSSLRLGPSSMMPGSFNDTLAHRLPPDGTQLIRVFDTFTIFSHLPLKIQQMVWRRALPGPRIMVIESILRVPFTFDYQSFAHEWSKSDVVPFNSYKSNHEFPNMMLASQEAFNDIEKMTTNNLHDYFDIVLPTDILEESVGHLVEPRLKHLALTLNHLDITSWPAEEICKRFLRRHHALCHITYVIHDETSFLPASQRTNIVFLDDIDIDYALELYSKNLAEVCSERIPLHPASAILCHRRADRGLLRGWKTEDYYEGERPFVVPDSMIVDYKIVVKREKAEELERRKKSFYVLKKEIVQGENAP